MTDYTTRWEILYAGDNPLGLLYRRWNETELMTARILGGDDPHRIGTTIALSGHQWTTCTYVENDDTPVTIDSSILIEHEDAIPEPLEFLILRDVVTIPHAEEHLTESYHVIHPSDSHGTAIEASMWTPDDVMWEIEAEGRMTSSHTVHNGEIIESRWDDGLLSRPASPTEAIATLRGIVDDETLEALLTGENNS